MNAVADELYGLLVPLSQDRLLVPRSCVDRGDQLPGADADGRRAAVVPRHRGLGRPPRAARVVRGRLRAGQPPRTSGRTRIVVMQGIGSRWRAAISPC